MTIPQYQAVSAKYSASAIVVTMDEFAREMLCNIWPEWSDHIQTYFFQSEVTRQYLPMGGGDRVSNDEVRDYFIDKLKRSLANEIYKGLAFDVHIEEMEV